MYKYYMNMRNKTNIANVIIFYLPLVRTPKPRNTFPGQIIILCANICYFDSGLISFRQLSDLYQSLLENLLCACIDKLFELPNG